MKIIAGIVVFVAWIGWELRFSGRSAKAVLLDTLLIFVITIVLLFVVWEMTARMIFNSSLLEFLGLY